MIKLDGILLNGYCSSFLQNPAAVTQSYGASQIKIASAADFGTLDSVLCGGI